MHRPDVPELRLSDGTNALDAESLGAVLLAIDPSIADEIRRSEIEHVDRALRHHWRPAELMAVAEGLS